jgi:hypothetical protein
VSSTTLPATVAMPREEELEKVVRALSRAVEVSGRLAWVIRRLRDNEDAQFNDEREGEELGLHRRQPEDPIPTIEEIGRLFSFGITVRGYLEELTQYLEDLTGAESLEELDYARVVAADKREKEASRA